jgi:hypothetical protein
MIDRLLQATAAFRQRHATHAVIAGKPAVDEAPLTDLAFAQALKKLRYVESGRFIIGELRVFFDDRAEKYSTAGDQEKAKVLREIANNLRETETTIKTFAEIEQQRTQGATAEKKRTNTVDAEARRWAIKAILVENGWGRSTSSLAKQVWPELVTRGFSVSPRTTERDLKAIFDTTSL